MHEKCAKACVFLHRKESVVKKSAVIRSCKCYGSVFELSYVCAVNYIRDDL